LLGDEEKLREMESVAVSMLEKRHELDGLAERHKSSRDQLNESVKSLRSQAQSEKEKRDEINEKVAGIKRRVEALRARLDEGRRVLGELEEEHESSRRWLPQRRKIEEELRRIEWELSTTPTLEMRDREEEMIARAGDLRRTLEEHERLDSQNNERVNQLVEVKAVEMEIRAGRGEMRELHDESQKHHELMLNLHRKADEEKERADEAHERFRETLSAIKEIDAELDLVMSEVRGLRRKLREEDRTAASRRERAVEDRREELAAEARRKMESGEKLTLDELKLIYGEE
jgi:uncharacterized coiled-coil DUF342 family protein